MKQALGVAPDVSNFAAPTFSHGYVPIYSTTTSTAPAQPPISTQPPFDPYGTYTYSVLGGRPFTASLGGGNGGGSGGGVHLEDLEAPEIHEAHYTIQMYHLQ